MNKDYKKLFLGKELEAVIDRPIGSHHPSWIWRYPINYGYIPNTKAGDGKEIDCFILGVDDPIKSFKGKCIAIIKRIDDNEDKLVLAPINKTFTKEEIKKLTYFQEKFFRSIIIT